MAYIYKHKTKAMKQVKCKKQLPMHLFKMIKEISLLNNQALKVDYPNGYNSTEIITEGSKNLPRKKKKKLRNLFK